MTGSAGEGNARGRWRDPRVWVVVLVVAVSAYLVLAAWRGVAFLGAGGLSSVVLGVAVLALPLLGAWLVWREIRFGRAMESMGRALEAEGDLPLDDFQRTASGRVTHEDAQRFFEREKARVDADPGDWRGWYRLGLAYDAARDRARARAAMREAIRLRDAGS